MKTMADMLVIDKVGEAGGRIEKGSESASQRDMKFAIASVEVGSFEGKLSADAASIDGKLQQGWKGVWAGSWCG